MASSWYGEIHVWFPSGCHSVSGSIPISRPSFNLNGFFSGEYTHYKGYHHSDVTLSEMASQITCVSICSGVDKKSKFRITGLWGGIHRWQLDYPHKRPATRKMFPFDDVTMIVIKPYNLHNWDSYSGITVYLDNSKHLLALMEIFQRGRITYTGLCAWNLS